MAKWKLNLKTKIMSVSVVPLLILSIILSSYSAYSTYKSAYDEIYHELHSMCVSIYEFTITENEDKSFTPSNLYNSGKTGEVFNGIKNSTGIDITVFDGDTRSITTISGENGENAVGTRAAPEVVEAVINSGSEYFSDNVEVNGTRYFGYYMPIYGSEDSVSGMTFAGKSRANVEKSIAASIRNTVIISLIPTLLVIAISLAVSGGMVRTLGHAVKFMNRIADGDTSCAPESELIERSDEIGEMGRSAVKLQQSLKHLISSDPLTGLLNRRSCNIMLHEMYENGESYTAVMCDIDHFKIFNDKYGHACGDDVLKAVSDILIQNTENCGFTARWGGEEFLIILKGSDGEDHMDKVRRIRSEIKNTYVVHGEQKLSVIMTFGVQASEKEMTPEEVINLADRKLYYGKNHGRDCIIDSIPEV
ncbi:MAG: diguanylate cyclase [Oscillospiraceae bacterium]